MIRIPKLLLPLLIFAPAAAAHADSDGPATAELAGHYYLQGVMEVGSELLLEEDGRFQWYLSYGAVDRDADGEWLHDARTITLVPRNAASPASFRPAESLPWDQQADFLLSERMKERAQAAFTRRCPIAIPQQETASAMSDAPFAGPPEEEELLISNEVAHIARDKTQAAIDELRGRPRWQEDREAITETNLLLSFYSEAERRWVYQSDRAKAAGMAAPAPPAPLQFPVECEAMDRPEKTGPEEIVPERGTLVGVFDPRRHTVADGFTVVATYDRGPPEQDVLGAGGVVFVPLPEGRRIVALTVLAPDGAAIDGEHRFPLTIAEPAIQIIHADLPPIEAPFERLRLTIEDDGGLRPVEGLQGRYVKNSAE